MKVQVRKRKAANGTVRYQAVIQPWFDGKVKTVTVGTFDTELEAQIAGAKEAQKYETNVQKKAALRGSTTLAAWAEEWLQNIDGQKKEGTPIHYRWRLEHWVLPVLGRIRLADLSRVHVQDWLDNLVGTKGGPLSNQSKQLALAALKTCLSGAVSKGALVSNPAADVKLSQTRALKKERQTKAVKVWSHEEAAKLLAAATGTRLEPMVVMGLLCGMRPGETQGLRWDDFDWLASSVKVQRSRTGTPNGTILTDSPKSGDDRIIKLEPDVLWRMMAVQERQKECFHGQRGGKPIGLLPPCPGECEWVFTIEPGAARKSLKKLCKELGIAELPPHSLRHTCNSLMGSAGIPSTARAALLGHSVRMNEATYSHAMPRDVERATEAVARLLFPPASDNLTQATQQDQVKQ